MSFEKSLLEMIENTEIDKDVRKAVKKGILYEENMTLCSPKILQYSNLILRRLVLLL